MMGLNLKKVTYAVKAILYELMPVHPLYAIEQCHNLVKIIRDLGVGLSPLIISGFRHSALLLFKTKPAIWLKIVSWFIGLKLFHYAGFGSLFIILSMFAAIFMNLDEKKSGDLSAYSVFNAGFKTLLGTMTAEQFDREIRHQDRNNFDDDDVDDDDNDNLGRGRGAGNNRNQDRPGAAAEDANANRPRRRGKKARRTYELRLQRRAALNQNQNINEPNEMEMDMDELEEFDD